MTPTNSSRLYRPRALKAQRRFSAWPQAALMILAGLCLGFVLTACGGGDDGPGVAPSVAPSGAIGPAGGTISVAGAQVIIPPGALTAPTTIAIEQTNVGAPALPNGFVAGGAMFAFMPHGTVFNLPVTISVPVDMSAMPAGLTPTLYKTNAAGEWERVPNATLSGSVVSAQVTSFSFGGFGAAPPTITRQPQDASVAAGSTATFGVTALGFPPFSYDWQLSSDAGINWTSVGSGFIPTFTTQATVAAEDGTRYRVIVSNFDGATPSQAATLTVTPLVVAPIITAHPASVSVMVGASATFSAVASGTSPMYQWQIKRVGDPGFTDINLATNASFTFANAQLTDNNALFQVSVSNTAGTVFSNPATLSVTSTPTLGAVTRIAAGAEFSLAVDKFGVPYSWGSDAIGGLGNGPLTGNRAIAAPMGTLTGVRSVSANSGGVAVRNDDTAWAWGYALYVNCGLGSTYETPLRIDATNIVAASGTLLLNGDGVVLSNCTAGLGPISPPIVVAGLPKITAIAAGNGFYLALDINGNVWSWGQGALGDGTPWFGPGRSTPAQIAGLSGVTAIAAGAWHALALRSGSVWAWGSNVGGQLGDGTTTDRNVPTATLLTSQITAIAAGENNSLALRGDGIALSWGENRYGQLGTGSMAPFTRSTPGAVTGLTDVVTIAAGKGRPHALALRSDGSVWAWGNNGAGQLGDGTMTERFTPVRVSGLNLN